MMDTHNYILVLIAALAIIGLLGFILTVLLDIRAELKDLADMNKDVINAELMEEDE